MTPPIHPNTVALIDKISAGNMVSHAYIFAGAASGFPTESAHLFAAQLLERTDPENAVDFWTITSEKSISIEAIRDLKHHVRFGPSQSRYLIVLITPADRLTPESANGLLKLLEEPPANTIFLLATSFPELLLATIRSRCQLIHCFSGHHPMPLESTAPSLAQIRKMPLIDRLTVAADLATQKVNAKAVLGQWLSELSLQSTLDPTEQHIAKILVEKLSSFQYNVNLRLHLESIMIRIDLGIEVNG